MKKRINNAFTSNIKYFVILLMIIIVAAIMFLISYESVKREVIDNLNARQMVHAKQAARGIESFFNNYIRDMQSLAKNEGIISLNETGKQIIKEYYLSHQEDISIISRTDKNGRILYPEPYETNVIGQPVSGLEDFQEAKHSGQFVISDALITKRGFMAIALYYPVYKKGSFNGTLNLLFPIDIITKRYLEEISITKDGYAWIIDKQGIELSCPVPGHVGKSVFDNCRNFPDILDMANKMIRGEEGIAEYKFDRIHDKAINKIKKRAFFMPVLLGNNFWSIVVAAPEEEFLSPLKNLRNRFVVLGSIAIIGLVFLFYLLLKNMILVKEVDHRQKTEQALRESEERYRDIFENAALGICQISPDGHFLNINLVGTKMYGFETPYQIVEPVTDKWNQMFVNADDYKLIKEILDAYGFVQGFETVQLKKDGSKFWSSINGRSVLDSAGTVIYYEILIENITERKHLEDQLRHAQKMETVGTLAGGIAHDFNNILTTIIGYGSLVQMKIGDENPAIKAYIEQIISASQKAADLTHSLLAFSRKQAIEPKIETINNILIRIKKLLDRLLTEDIELQICFADPDLTIMADITQIDQVLINLTTNARDSMPQGGKIVIAATSAELNDELAKSYQLMEPGTYVLISVTDTGCGMDKKTKEKIFEPFFTTKEVGKGTGLGLSMIYGIIKQHNGYINVFSEINKGTTFQIYLPTIKNVFKETENVSLNTRGGNETILIAEDNFDIRELLKEILDSKGYKVFESFNGEDAVITFIEHKDSIDLLLLDVVMPKKNGKTAYDEIRKIKPDIKVLFISGHTGDIVLEKGVQSGSVNFISKPLLLDELLLKVREILDR